MIKDVYYFTNGNAAVLDMAGQQMPELQVPIYEPIIQAAIARNEDPTRIIFNLPNGKIGKAFKTEDGSYNMSI